MKKSDEDIILGLKNKFGLTSEEMIDLYIDYKTNGITANEALLNILIVKLDGYSTFDLLEMHYTYEEIKQVDEHRDKIDREKEKQYVKKYLFPSEQ